MLYLFVDLYPSDDSKGESGGLVVRPGLVIPDSELEYRTARSSGPGGQHVNKVETRVTVMLDLSASMALSAEQKARVRERLATRVTRSGVLRVVSQKHRSQAANRDEARERMAELLAEALRARGPRKRTRPSAAAKRRRLDAKRRRGELKRSRRDPRAE